MSSSNRYLFNKLNNYDYSEENIKYIKQYIKNKTLPPNLITNHKKALFQKRFNDFELKDNKLYYKPLDLQVIEEDDKQKAMKELYDDMKIGPGSSIRGFYNKIQQRYLNIKRDDVDKFIKDEPAYQITTHEKQKMVNHPNLSHFPNQKWSCDLIDMSLYEGYNKHKKWILTVIDNFSRYVFAVALPNKESKTIIEGFEKIMDKSQGNLPKLLINDNGGEFKNEMFEEWARVNKITLKLSMSHTT
jgi:IS30 family transposase